MSVTRLRKEDETKAVNKNEIMNFVVLSELTCEEIRQKLIKNRSASTAGFSHSSSSSSSSANGVVLSNEALEELNRAIRGREILDKDGHAISTENYLYQLNSDLSGTVTRNERFKDTESGKIAKKNNWLWPLVMSLVGALVGFVVGAAVGAATFNPLTAVVAAGAGVKAGAAGAFTWAMGSNTAAAAGGLIGASVGGLATAGFFGCATRGRKDPAPEASLASSVATSSGPNFTRGHS